MGRHSYFFIAVCGNSRKFPTEKGMVLKMGKTVRVRVSAKPISNRSVRVKTSISSGGTTRTKTQTIRMK